MNEEFLPTDTEASSNEESFSKNKVYKCNFPGCLKSFSRPSRLATHALIHSGERPHKCNICGKDYTRSAHLKRHIANTHDLEKKSKSLISCSDCSSTFSDKYSLSKHKNRFHPNETLSCNKCSKIFAKQKQYARHMEEHNGKSSYSCNLCDKTFTIRSKLLYHRKHVHEKIYGCDQCEMTNFKNWTELRKHISEVHNPRGVYKCTTCGKSFLTSPKLSQHVIIHFEERMVYHCPKEGCSRFYYFERNLTQHLQSYHDKKRFECLTCHKTFVTKQKLQQHSESHNEPKQQSHKIKSTGSRRIKGRRMKSMAAILSSYSDVNPSHEREVLLRDISMPLNPKDIEKEIIGSPVLSQEFNDVEDGVNESRDSVQICERNFTINQTKSSIMKYFEPQAIELPKI